MSLRCLSAEPTRDSAQDYIWTLNFGPQHPATHTTLRLVLKLDGERVVDAVPDIGYLHSGFEKIGESLNYNQYVTVTDRTDYLALGQQRGLARGRREASRNRDSAALPVHPHDPGRASCARSATICCAMARVELDVGAFTYFLYDFNRREDLYDIFEALCGARFTNSYTRVGGLMYDMTPMVIEMVRTFVRTFPKTLGNMERLLNRNRIFVDRTCGGRRAHE